MRGQVAACFEWTGCVPRVVFVRVARKGLTDSRASKSDKERGGGAERNGVRILLFAVFFDERAGRVNFCVPFKTRQ